MTADIPARTDADIEADVATLKSAIDGLRDYRPTKRDPAGWRGVVRDDTPEHVTWEPPIIHPPDPSLTERLVLVVTDLSERNET